MKSIHDRVIMVANYLKCIWRLADMEERGGVLVQNEKHANKSVAKVMRITFLIFSIVFLLNVLGIFVVLLILRRRYMDERCVSCI